MLCPTRNLYPPCPPRNPTWIPNIIWSVVFYVGVNIVHFGQLIRKNKCFAYVAHHIA